MSKLSRALRSDMMGNLNMPALAQVLRSKGRGRDTMLAHITEEEAKLLMAIGGSGTINPHTGLPEFESDFTFDTPTYETPDYSIAPQSGGGVGFKSPDFYTPTTETAQAIGYTPTEAPGLGFRSPSADFYTPGFGQVQSGGGPGMGAVPNYGIEPPAGGMGVAPHPGALQSGVMGVPSSPTGTSVTPMPETQKPEEGAWDKFISKLDPQTVAKLGLGAAGGLVGQKTGARAAKQMSGYEQQLEQMAHPYRSQGAEMVRAAQAGELLPVGQQAVQSLRAKLNQEVASRGGVGAQQAANQVEAFRQQLLQNQFNFGLQVSQIADNIMQGAIKTGMQADQMVAQAHQNFFSAMAQMLGTLPK